MTHAPVRILSSAWTDKYLTWVKTVRFAHAAQEATVLDYVHEVEHVAERLVRLEKAIDEAVDTAPVRMRAVIGALQALRGIARVSAATIVHDLHAASLAAGLIAKNICVVLVPTLPLGPNDRVRRVSRQRM